MGTNRRTRNKRKDSERNQRKNSKGSGRRTGEEELLMDKYRRFKKEMKEEDYSGSLESMVWLRTRTNSLNLGNNSWQRNREICVGCSEERENSLHHSSHLGHCPRWEEWRIESRSLHRRRIEETDPGLWRIPVRRTRK